LREQQPMILPLIISLAHTLIYLYPKSYLHRIPCKVEALSLKVCRLYRVFY